MTRMVDPLFKEQSFPKPKKRTGLRAFSKKARARQAALAEYELGGPCEAAVLAVCTGTAEHRHHKRRRSQGGGEDRANIVCCCNACHSHIHANPAEARALGLLVFGIDNWEAS